MGADTPTALARAGALPADVVSGLREQIQRVARAIGRHSHGPSGRGIRELSQDLEVDQLGS